jgi:hypothetical protein
MCGFEIGDIVKCINVDYDGDNMRFGNLYKIRDILLKDNVFYLYLDSITGEKIIGGWFTQNFEKVELCKENPFTHFCNIQILHDKKGLKLTVRDSYYDIKIYNDLTTEGSKRIELWNVITYHNDKCEIADENMRKAIECACEIYDMVFT